MPTSINNNEYDEELRVKVLIERNGETIWYRNDKDKTGMTSTAYLKDGTQKEIVSALEMALAQAKGESGITEYL